MKHLTNIEKYDGTLRELTKDIGNLKYDSLVDFFKYFSEKFEKDSESDLNLGHLEISKMLKQLAIKMNESEEITKSLWKICKKYME